MTVAPRLVQTCGTRIGGTSVDPIRIHLGHMPPMLRTIIKDLLLKESDLAVVGCSGEGEDPLAQALEEGADMLITQDRSHGGNGCLDAMISAPLRSILAIGPDGRNAAAIDLGRRSVKLDAGAGTGFVEAIRCVAADL